jgi:hypothetical protein
MKRVGPNLLCLNVKQMKEMQEFGKLLSRKEKKSLKGGLSDDTGNSCGVNTYNKSGGLEHCERGLSRAEAQATAATTNRENEGTGWITKWCCDSCGPC